MVHARLDLFLYACLNYVVDAGTEDFANVFLHGLQLPRLDVLHFPVLLLSFLIELVLDSLDLDCVRPGARL